MIGERISHGLGWNLFKRLCTRPRLNVYRGKRIYSRLRDRFNWHLHMRLEKDTK